MRKRREKENKRLKEIFPELIRIRVYNWVGGLTKLRFDTNKVYLKNKVKILRICERAT
jgi:hypothetical protein